MVERDFSRWRYASLENRILIRLAWIFGGVWLFALFVAGTVGYYVTTHEPGFKRLQSENIELKRHNQILYDRVLLLDRVLSDFGITHGFDADRFRLHNDTTQSKEPKNSQMWPPGVIIEH